MDTKVSLSWESHQKNICKGLSLLQQRGEFVDMTLAADGHHVKVHQMVMSLVSPFIKDLISSAQCPHPVIFLNGVSYETLKSILEYAYSGEVMVQRECLYQFLEACQALHIKGLENDSIKATADREMLRLTRHNDSTPQQTEPVSSGVKKADYAESKRRRTLVIEEDAGETLETDDHLMNESHISSDAVDEYEVSSADKQTDTQSAVKSQQQAGGSTLHYSLSCQGSIQIILNRYVYRLRHARKNNQKMWRCGDYNKKRCPAYVITKGDVVLERGCAHSHPFHDGQILKRIRTGNIFTQFKAAEHHATLARHAEPHGDCGPDTD